MSEATGTQERDALAGRDSSGLLSVTGFEALANRICMHTPPGCVISVRFEDGAAWVELRKDCEPEDTPLPDATDKSLLQQIHDALLVANGWST